MSNGLSITQWLIVFASVVLIALPDSQPFAEATFELKADKANADKVNATALVTEKKLDLTIETGSVSGYPSSGKKFDLIVGGCTLKIDAMPYKEGVQFDINHRNLGYFRPKSFTITDTEVKLSYGTATTENLCTSNTAKFEEKDGKFLLEVTLSGDIPQNLKLSSSSANTYNPNGDNDGGLSAGAIAGISVASVVGLLAIGGGVGGYFGYRAYKRKKQAKLNEKTQLKTAVNVENGLESKSKTLDKSKLKDDKSKKDERRKESDEHSKEKSESVKKHKRDKKKERRKGSDKHSKERSESIKKSKSEKKKDDAKSSKEPARNEAEEAKQKAKEEANAKEPIYETPIYAAPLITNKEALARLPPKGLIDN